MPQLETRRYAAGFAHVRSTVDSPRRTTHVLDEPRFISRRSGAAAQSYTSHPLPLVLRVPYAVV